MATTKSSRMDSTKSIQEVAYENNSKAFQEGISPTDSMNYYTEWCKTGGYDKEIQKNLYNGPRVAGETVAKLYPVGRDKISILDIAAGTGYVGEELRKHGFTQMDGLDPSVGMLEEAKVKNIYSQYICDVLGGTSYVIPDDAYDCAVLCGAMGNGHIPCSGLFEMIRVVKPGGFICNVMREEYLTIVPEYKDKLEPLMQQLENQGIWEKVDRITFPKHFCDKVGVTFIHRVLVNGTTNTSSVNGVSAP